MRKGFKMFKYLVVFVILFTSLKVIGGSNDSTLYYKKILKKNYTELDSGFQKEVVNNSWKLISIYEPTLGIFRKFENWSSIYFIEFINSTVRVNYGYDFSSLKSYTVDFVFDDITPDFLIFKLGKGEQYAYQILRFEGNYMVVNKYNINMKGKLKNAHTRLLFEKVI